VSDGLSVSDGSPARGAAVRLNGVAAGYGGFKVLHDISLDIAPATVVALLGPNGAGKTTLLRVAAGLLPPRKGSIEYDGADVTKWSAARRSRAGLCLIPEGRGVFPGLTVRENIRLLAKRGAGEDAVAQVVSVFPALRAHLGRRAGAMSGGQQQMLAIARAWLASPRVVLLDEVSMGLAPLVVGEIFEALAGLRGLGTTVLLVEQYVDQALALADTVHLLDRGRLVFSGATADLDKDAVLRSYLGMVAN
jgi:branched-chain amino acid transport system ATP-binding protein